MSKLNRIKSFFFKSRKRIVVLSVLATMMVSLVGTCAFFADHIGAQMYLTIAQWKGDPVIQQWTEDATTDFHAYKDTITEFAFLDEYDETVTMDAGPWDVSHAQDESVMAYIVGTKVYICSSIGEPADIIANPYSSFAYAGFTYVNSVSGTDNMDTSHAITMEGMFKEFGNNYNDATNPPLDLSTWDTLNVTTMKSMFYAAGFSELKVGNFNTSKVEDMSFMFAACRGYPTLDVSNWDVSNVKTMESMFDTAFYGTGSFSLDVSKWDTGNVKNMANMFKFGERLLSLDISKWNVSKVETMESMFQGCTQIASLGSTGLSNWNTSSLKQTKSMFQSCSELTAADISKWNMSKIENSDYMFLGCSSLTELTIPASYKNIGTKFAAYCPAMTTINFLHTESDSITFPAAGSSTGAFYLNDYVQTKITGIDEVQAYDWISDHRRLDPVIRTWCYNTENGYTWDRYLGTMGGYVLPGIDFHTETLAPTITSIVFDDQNAYWAYPGMTSGDANGVVDGINVWDVSAAKNKSVIAWIDNTGKLTIAADGPEVVANENSGFVFALFDNVVTIDARKYDTSRAKNINHWHWFNDPDMHPGEPEFAIPMTGATTILGLETWDVSNVEDFSSMFHNDKNLTSIDVSTWDTGSAVYMDGVFLGCDKLTSLDLSGWDMTNVTTIESMFCRASGLTKESGISQWVMPNLENMEHTFSRTSFKSLDLNNWKPEKLVSMFNSFADSTIESIDMTEWSTPNLQCLQSTFLMTKNLKSLDLKNFTTNKVETMYQMCEGSGIETIDLTGWDFRVCADVDSMFQDADRLEEVTGEDTWTNMHGIESMSRMFSGCESLKSLDVTDWDVSNVTGTYSFNYVFNNCKTIEELDVKNWDVSSGENFTAMFMNCENLKEIDISNWDMASFSYNSYMEDMFNGCKQFTELTFPARVNFFTFRMAANCPKLTKIEFLTEDTLDSRVTAGATDGAFYVAPDSGVEIPVITQYITHSASMATLRSLYAWSDDNRAFPAVTVTYNANGGAFDDNSTTNVVKYETPNDIVSGEYKEPTISDPYKSFDGWYTDQACTDGNEFDLNTTYSDITVYAKWKEIPHFTVTYDANGGHYADASTQNLVEHVIMKSKTANVSDDGSTHTGNYGDSLATTEVITIPGATSLEVTITYQTESKSYDWVCVYDGSVTPSSTNYDSSISGKLGGTTKTTAQYTVEGDTVQFFIKSDSSISNYYGYYAVVSGTISGEYEEPVHNDVRYGFDGWYTDKACTDGKEFDPGTATEDITVYAKWAKVPAILAPTNTWFSQGSPKNNGTSIAKNEITSISIVDSYNTSGKTIIDQWDASTEGTGAEDNTGPVTAYLEYDSTGTTYKLTLAGNGNGKVYANPDSSNAFGWFRSLTTFSGSNILDMSMVTKMGDISAQKGMFTWCEKLKSLDVSNWDVSNVTRMRAAFEYCKVLKTLDVSDWDVSSVTDFDDLFSNCQSITTLDVSKWDTSSATSMSDVFSDMTSITTLDVSKWNMSKVRTTLNMFNGCENLTSLNLTNWNISNMLDMNSTFNGCKKLTTIGSVSNWSTGNVRDMTQLFCNCTVLNGLDVSKWDVHSVQYMKNMFKSCKALTILDVSDWVTSSLKDTDSTFYNCPALTTIDVSNWDMADVTTMETMFTFCTGVKRIPVENWTTTSVENLGGMFDGCTALTSLDLSKWDTSNVTAIGKSSNYSGMFMDCSALTSLNVSTWDTSNVTDMGYMFEGCSSLGTLDLSSWSTASATKMTNAFKGMNKLATVTLGSDFAFVGTDGYLPTPSGASGYLNNSSVDGKWYNTTTTVGYTPAALATSHSGLVTYSAYNPAANLLSLAFDSDTGTVTGYTSQ